ncbi:hypothetical protein FEM48_Zijuj05G0151100 [Ziziphus jujuba var. spinosa]|uniref:Uncharacterized protein n=1 Tax=Ziziphus jujuba var. spinosa TaxID=714518 RepID=A0A978VFI6_ZIZJJ|nr:hypothetical protein FEM48_Zijuj05G0151100 [Ziziphus jujuba var. spinosa]
MKMNTPRCLFGSASLGEIAILAGGCGPSGNILSSAELYNSETGDWVTLPSMNKPRKMCSAVFMHGKFYVIGGIGEGSPKSLTCGEVYDLEKMTWTKIPDMFPIGNGRAGLPEAPATAGRPPLFAVVNNILYAAEYVGNGVMRYKKEENKWDQIGSLPDGAEEQLNYILGSLMKARCNGMCLPGINLEALCITAQLWDAEDMLCGESSWSGVYNLPFQGDEICFLHF